MNRILVLFGHPAFKRSIINAALRAAVENLDGITFHDLYASYPDFFIDVGHEQQLCEDHDIIIFQHPFYWYSTPAIFKEWMDLVLEHDWAYGSRGNALEGKLFMQTFTAGGDASSYSGSGLNKHTIGELTSPIKATANLCRMRWFPPFGVLGVHRGLDREKLVEHAEEYRRLLIGLRDNQLDLDRASRTELINTDLRNLLLSA